MPLYLDEQLNKKEKKSLEDHIAGCKECGQKLKQYQEMLDDLKSMPGPELPDGLHVGIMERLNEQVSESAGIKPVTGSLKVKFRDIKRVSYRKYVTAAAVIVCAMFMLSAVVTGLSAVTRAVTRRGSVNDISGNSGAAVREYALSDNAGDTAGADVVVIQEDGSIIASEQGMAETETEAALYGADVYEADTDNVIAKTTMSVEDVAAGTGSVDDAAPASRMIYEITLKVKSVDETVDVISRLGGYNTSANINYSGAFQNGNIVRRVSVDQYREVVEMLRNLGEVVSETESEEMLAGQRLDTQAKLSAKEEERERLFALLEKSKTMNVMVMVEGRLSVVESEIDMYKSSLMNLNNSANEPEIYIRLEADVAVQEEESTGNFSKRIRGSFIASLNSTISFMEQLIVFVSGAIVPCLIIAAVVLVIVFIARLTMKRGGRDEDGRE